MKHIISMERVHSRKEAGESETSRGNDRSVIGHEKGSFEEEKFKKLREAPIKRQNQATTKPKIRKVVLVHLVLLKEKKNYILNSIN
jgi:hypothetical protein